VSAVRLVATGPDARDGWEKVAISAHDQLAICHQPVWMDCVTDSGTFVDATRLYETADGRQLVLPLVRRAVTPGPVGLYESWPPYWEGARDSGGLISEHGPVTAADVRGVLADLRRLPAVRIRVVPSTHDAAAWQQAAPESIARLMPLKAFVVDLSGGFEQIWSQRSSKKTRYKVRKAERSGVEVEHDSTGRLLPVFDQLYRRSVDAWADAHFLPTPVARRLIERRHDHRKLCMVAGRLGEACRVWIAWKDGEALSGIVVHSSGAAATYWKGATDKAKVRALGATDLLHSRAMQLACEEGRSRYDLGTSGLESLSQFKLSLGAAPVRYHSYQVERVPLTAAQEWMRARFKNALGATAGA
jgi:hypothetical protein